MIAFLRLIDKFLGELFKIFKPLLSFRRRENANTIRKILLIKLWGLGNLVIIWPLVQKIREKYPLSLIYFLTFDLNKGFLERNPAINRIIYFKFTKNIFEIIAQFVYLLLMLRKENIDLVINFETFNNASALFSYLTGAPLCIGLNNKHEHILYNYWVDNNPSLHVSQIFQSLLSPINMNFPYMYYYFPQYSQEETKVEETLEEFAIERFICIHPGTSENFKGKRWRRDNFIELSNMLIEKYNLPLIFTGTDREKSLITEIIKNISSKDKVFDLAGCLNIWEFIELIRKTTLLISNDTAPVHIAASLKKNIVAFYGPTSPQRYGPLNENTLIFYKNLNCSPCIGVDYMRKRCRKSFKCLSFTPKEVFSKIQQKFFSGEDGRRF